ncbi:uncharacterized protein ARMOST_20139 [Armillaria ostoyae]|uniref:Ig-like domain-containing protein n=1 Tax=Armillaria ostoyae TaxID=47428 RepID=A0A284S6H7_ARMOS|nr:uncharacterized protein ARMOST_20139 [Armillaria ostoyae]
MVSLNNPFQRENTLTTDCVAAGKDTSHSSDTRAFVDIIPPLILLQNHGSSSCKKKRFLPRMSMFLETMNQDPTREGGSSHSNETIQCRWYGLQSREDVSLSRKQGHLDTSIKRSWHQDGKSSSREHVKIHRPSPRWKYRLQFLVETTYLCPASKDGGNCEQDNTRIKPVSMSRRYHLKTRDRHPASTVPFSSSRDVTGAVDLGSLPSRDVDPHSGGEWLSKW